MCAAKPIQGAIGASNRPVYIAADGTITPIAGAIGGATLPIYVNGSGQLVAGNAPMYSYTPAHATSAAAGVLKTVNNASFVGTDANGDLVSVTPPSLLPDYTQPISISNLITKNCYNVSTNLAGDLSSSSRGVSLAYTLDNVMKYNTDYIIPYNAIVFLNHRINTMTGTFSTFDVMVSGVVVSTITPYELIPQSVDEVIVQYASQKYQDGGLSFIVKAGTVVRLHLSEASISRTFSISHGINWQGQFIGATTSIGGKEINITGWADPNVSVLDDFNTNSRLVLTTDDYNKCLLAKTKASDGSWSEKATIPTLQQVPVPVVLRAYKLV